ncbi:MAG: GNAT family N-acetyltransferase [Clostridiales bacterium]|jgi:ribosomal protein S18 acetylase RimI-like enzyme|nr:GNAT family N-acetyltransferase [Clostridiales bacterium]
MFRLAKYEELDIVIDIYDRLAGHLEENINYSHWKKGVYPVAETAEDGIKGNSLFVLVDESIENKIVGSVILNSDQPAQYENAPFDKRFKGSEVLVIHTLVVDPMYLRNNIGWAIMCSIDKYAVSNGFKTIRLDTYYKNTPASGLYEKAGYNLVGLFDLELGFKGLFKLYEKVLC